MLLSDQIPIYSLKCGLQPFQVFGVYCIFIVKVTITSKKILADNMDLEKIRYLLFHI